MSHTLPKISLIVPCYNAEKYIGHCLYSIKDQQYANIQVIVVDGASNDSTLSIIDEYSDNIEILITEPDQGQSDAILKGLDHVDGEIWGWLNADDVLHKDALKTIGENWLVNDRPSFIYGVANKIDENSIIIKEGRYHPFSYKRLKDIFYITQPACFFNTEMTMQLGGPKKHLHYVMDWEFVLRLGSESNAIGISKVIADLRVHKDTKTSMGGYERSQEIAIIGKAFGGYLNKNYLSFLVLNIFYLLERRTSIPLFRRLRRLCSRVFDRVWGHTNYMIHDHTFA